MLAINAWAAATRVGECFSKYAGIRRVHTKSSMRTDVPTMTVLAVGDNLATRRLIVRVSRRSRPSPWIAENTNRGNIVAE
jgi:hypothetical protein